jgi:hypothetical protein
LYRFGHWLAQLYGDASGGFFAESDFGAVDAVYDWVAGGGDVSGEDFDAGDHAHLHQAGGHFFGEIEIAQDAGFADAEV